MIAEGPPQHGLWLTKGGMAQYNHVQKQLKVKAVGSHPNAKNYHTSALFRPHPIY